MNKTAAKKINEIYDAVNALMTAGCWNFLDDHFNHLTLKTWRIDLDELLAYATASFPGKSKIPSRKRFIQACKDFHSNYKLWKGLE